MVQIELFVYKLRTMRAGFYIGFTKENNRHEIISPWTAEKNSLTQGNRHSELGSESQP